MGVAYILWPTYAILFDFILCYFDAKVCIIACSPYDKPRNLK